LRLKDKWDPTIDEDRPAPVAKPVGVPGASSPLQMTPDRLKSKIMAKPPPSPLKGKVLPVNKRVGEFDVGDELSGFGLQGVKVTEDELRDLVAELGLDGDEAGDLVKGLSDAAGTPPKQAAPSSTVDEAGDLVKSLSDTATPPKQVAPSSTVDEAGDLVKGLSTPSKQVAPSNTVDEAGDLVEGFTTPPKQASSNNEDETVTVIKESLDLNNSKLETEKT
jgi:SH3 domain-binding glutamic acid-rich protein